MICKCVFALTAVSSVIAQKPDAWLKDAVECSPNGSDFTLTVKTANGIRNITTTGCPDYDWTGQTTPNEAVIKSDVYEVPLNPIICKNPTVYVGVYKDLEMTIMNPNPIMAAIGVAYDGVAIYSNSDSESRDAFIYESDTFDHCNGHAAADGTYHYHAQVPDDCLIIKPVSTAHSDIYGFMADGIPLYGPLGDGGIFPTDLDECNGHTDMTYDFYHYHITANYQYPYTVNCLKAVVDITKWTNFNIRGFKNTCIEAAVQYDYSFIENVWANDETPESNASSTSESPEPEPVSNEPSSSDTYPSKFSIIAVGSVFILAFFLYQRWKSSHIALPAARNWA